ncbi:MAG: NADH-quinone oxidoreductase subunit NuoK [Candidatus Sumerlaeia bacterium]|nr:NADH-quinone oxidoreductase subunit NuoK [Candidatus Sumerlaeia bacterium]
MSPLLFEGNLLLSLLLFTMGILGVVWKRNAIAVFLSVELMLNAANLAIVSFAHAHGLMSGGILALFIMTVAAAEAGVGLAIFIALFRAKQNIHVDEVDLMRG